MHTVLYACTRLAEARVLLLTHSRLPTHSHLLHTRVFLHTMCLSSVRFILECLIAGCLIPVCHTRVFLLTRLTLTLTSTSLHNPTTTTMAAVAQAVLHGAEVICAQMISAGSNLFDRLGRFSAILVDEVAQSTELNVIVPIVQRGCHRLVLVGDHYQLPPTVQSEEAEQRGLTLSLYGRLVRQGLAPWFLDTQHRAHPKLMEFVARTIYGGRLRSG
jgi:hypothetical protein